MYTITNVIHRLIVLKCTYTYDIATKNYYYIKNNDARFIFKTADKTSFRFTIRVYNNTLLNFD